MHGVERQFSLGLRMLAFFHSFHILEQRGQEAELYLFYKHLFWNSWNDKERQTHAYFQFSSRESAWRRNGTERRKHILHLTGWAFMMVKNKARASSPWLFLLTRVSARSGLQTGSVGAASRSVGGLAVSSPFWAPALPGGSMNTWWEASLTPLEGMMEQELGVSKEKGTWLKRLFKNKL